MNDISTWIIIGFIFATCIGIWHFSRKNDKSLKQAHKENMTTQHSNIGGYQPTKTNSRPISPGQVRRNTQPINRLNRSNSSVEANRVNHDDDGIDLDDVLLGAAAGAAINEALDDDNSDDIGRGLVDNQNNNYRQVAEELIAFEALDKKMVDEDANVNMAEEPVVHAEVPSFEPEPQQAPSFEPEPEPAPTYEPDPEPSSDWGSDDSDAGSDWSD